MIGLIWNTMVSMRLMAMHVQMKLTLLSAEDFEYAYSRPERRYHPVHSGGAGLVGASVDDNLDVSASPLQGGKENGQASGLTQMYAISYATSQTMLYSSSRKLRRCR